MWLMQTSRPPGSPRTSPWSGLYVVPAQQQKQHSHYSTCSTPTGVETPIDQRTVFACLMPAVLLGEHPCCSSSMVRRSLQLCSTYACLHAHASVQAPWQPQHLPLVRVVRSACAAAAAAAAAALPSVICSIKTGVETPIDQRTAFACLKPAVLLGEHPCCSSSMVTRSPQLCSTYACLHVHAGVQAPWQPQHLPLVRVVGGACAAANAALTCVHTAFACHMPAALLREHPRCSSSIALQSTTQFHNICLFARSPCTACCVKAHL
jgi:hypothetical protein